MIVMRTNNSGNYKVWICKRNVNFLSVSRPILGKFVTMLFEILIQYAVYINMSNFSTGENI